MSVRETSISIYENVIPANCFTLVPQPFNGFFNSIEYSYFLMYILTTGILGVAAWQLWVQAMRVQKAGQTTGPLEIVIYPFLFIAAVGTLLIALVYLVFFLNSLGEAGK